MKSSTQESVDFLQRYEPAGPWALTAITVDRKSIFTQTFHPAQVEEMVKWIEQYEGERNMYFHVNPVRYDITKKAERQDIKAVNWLHVDIDPRPGEDVEDEQSRALKLLQNPPGGVPVPNCIIFSGGGYQGFWRLEDPIDIDGDLAKAEQAKLFNMQLEILFGADNCHNIDRIMRLPGTMNIPDAKKKKKGRKAVKAALVALTDDVYPLAKFTPAAQVTQSYSGDGFAGSTVEIKTGNIDRYASIDDLPEELSDQMKVVIVQGHDPQEPNKYASRSEALFAVCCAMVRVGMTNEQIFAVITDKDFGISASVIDKGSKAESYAIRQIERSREEAVDPNLRKMNEKHAVIGDIGGKCVVISETYDATLKRTKISRQSFDNIRNRYMNKQVKVGENKDGVPIFVKLGAWWLGHPMRRQYETLIFAPGQVVPDVYNLWKGFNCDARPGQCDLFLAHIKNIICGGDEENYKYVIGWMARAVQQPDSPGEVALVLRGRKGTGKSIFAKQFGALWGRHYLQVSNSKHLVGQFNQHLRDCVVLFADEAFYAGDKQHESILKTLITEEHITIEAKGVDAEAAPNYVHLIMASNNKWIVPAGGDERRYLVLDVSDDKLQDLGYFLKIKAEMDKGGREALLHYLMSYDLSEYEVRKVPKTEALQEQKLLSLSPEEEWWFNKLQEGRLLDDQYEWNSEIQKISLLNDYLDYMKNIGVMRRANATSLGRFLHNACPEGWPKTSQKYVDAEHFTRDGFKIVKKTRPYFYQFPQLDACRAQFDKMYGGPYTWQAISNESPPPTVQDAF